MRSCPPFALAVLLVGCSGCPDEVPSDIVRDATPDAASDASVRTRRVRRRNRRSAAHSRTMPATGSSVPPDESPDEDLGEEAPAARPRITETGPMLPDDLGPAPEVHYDLGGPSDGPMGLQDAQVRRALDPLVPRLARCAAATTDSDGRGPHGRVRVRLRVRNDGRPTAAQVSGGGGPPEFVACVRRVLASARFESFRGPDVLVGWGFDVD